MHANRSRRMIPVRRIIITASILTALLVTANPPARAAAPQRATAELSVDTAFFDPARSVPPGHVPPRGLRER